MLGQTNAKIVTGGNVEVVENTSNEFFIRTSENSRSNVYPNKVCWIDDKNFVFYIASYSGLKTVYTAKVKINNGVVDYTQISSIVKDIGATYSSGDISFPLRADVSPDKTKVAIIHFGEGKISIFPLINTNGEYSLGTPTTYDVAEFAYGYTIRWVSNDTFVIAQSSDTYKLYGYKIENDNLSLVATYTNTEVITGILTSGETILATNSNSKTVWFLNNIIDQNIIYTEVLSDTFDNLQQNYKTSFVIDNKFFLHTSNNSARPFKIFTVENNTISSLVFTSSVSVGTTIGSVRTYKKENNIIGLLLSGSLSGTSYIGISAIEIDFIGLTIKSSASVINNTTYSSLYGYGELYIDFDTNIVYMMLQYQADYKTENFLYNIGAVPYIINYNGWQYAMVTKV